MPHVREETMKYMIEWTLRTVGLTHDQNFASVDTLQTAFGKWTPEKGLTVLAFVGALAGNSGYVLVEAGDPEVVASFVTKFGYWNDIDVVPVIDIGDVVAITARNMAWARAASKPSDAPVNPE
jgi:Protein of unknown function (DUF3303)